MTILKYVYKYSFSVAHLTLLSSPHFGSQSPCPFTLVTSPLLLPPIPPSLTMKPGSVAKWLEDNADAPPPPTVPSSLPDDTVSTVYPESSVSNPNASRYTGRKHRAPLFASSRATYPPATYLERRPSSAQALYRDQPPAVRNRLHSVSADSRYAAAPQQPFLYAYTHTKSNSNPNYYAPVSAHYNRAHSPNRGTYVPAQASSTPYRVVSPSPHRVEPSVGLHISICMLL